MALEEYTRSPKRQWQRAHAIYSHIPPQLSLLIPKVWWNIQHDPDLLHGLKNVCHCQHWRVVCMNVLFIFLKCKNEVVVKTFRGQCLVGHPYLALSARSFRLYIMPVFTYFMFCLYAVFSVCLPCLLSQVPIHKSLKYFCLLKIQFCSFLLWTWISEEISPAI